MTLLRLFTAVALLTAPAVADTGKTWVSEGCGSMVQSAAEGQFAYADMSNNDPAVTCRIADWPINDPVATLACSDGSEPKMSFPEGATAGVLLFNDVLFYEIGVHKLGFCD